MNNKILVTRSSMPDYEEYCKEIKELWDSHWLTNMGVKHRQFQAELEKGSVKIKVPALGNDVYNLIYKGKNLSYGLSLGRCFGKISCKFEEPNPMNRSE